MQMLDVSESTIRRDLLNLHKMGKLMKIHGGAMSILKEINTKEERVSIRENISTEDKHIIAKIASEQICDNDFVYIDAGTTTVLIPHFLRKDLKATFVTNGIEHSKRLIAKGLNTYVIAGKIKPITEAIVGVDSINCLKKYNFNKGFFGTNGVSIEKGFTTPDIQEAQTKEEAIKKCGKVYILADRAKIGEVYSITFCDIKKATILTNKMENEKYKQITKVIEV